MLIKRRTRTFPGGIHLPECKAASADRPIRVLEAPDRAVVLLAQHAGVPARPVVARGDRVRTGDPVGEPAALISAAVHSPVTGTVTGLSAVTGPQGTAVDAVVIERDPGPEETACAPPLDWRSAGAETIGERVRDAGVVGLGGAAFPAAVKFAPPRPVDSLILNGCECEPFLTADDRLMIERLPEVLEGAFIIARMLGVGSLYLAIEDNKPAALRQAREAAAAAADRPRPVVVPLGSKYPQGAEKNVIQAVLGREVPSGGLPMDVGAVVANVGTAVAVQEAVCHGVPLYRRVVTVSGAVARPDNLLVRIGTPLEELVAACGGFTADDIALVMGGPMMGQPLPGLDFPVVKGTSGLVALRREQLRPFAAGPCLRCGRCVDACPLRLQPWRYGVHAERGFFEASESLSVRDCMECGVCTWVCPARRPNVQWIKLTKAMLARARREKGA